MSGSIRTESVTFNFLLLLYSPRVLLLPIGKSSCGLPRDVMMRGARIFIHTTSVFFFLLYKVCDETNINRSGSETSAGRLGWLCMTEHSETFQNSANIFLIWFRGILLRKSAGCETILALEVSLMFRQPLMPKCRQTLFESLFNKFLAMKWCLLYLYAT